MGCERVRQEVQKYSGWDVDVMTAISMAESGCNQSNHNLTSTENHGVCVGSYGALQVGCVHFGPGDDMESLEDNVRIAHAVWKKQGYNAWSVYANGKYLRFIGV